MSEIGEMRVHYVRVNNNLDVDFTDRYDGIPITVDSHGWQNLRLDMAEHLFGYRDGATDEDMFRHVCKRQGWNTIEYLKVNPKTGKTLAQEQFAKLEIKPVTFRMVEEKPNTDEPIPADPQPKLADDELPAMPKRKAS